jgi:hypothetical protein
MIENEKLYMGSAMKIENAAMLYDITLVQAKGLRARTNFRYTRAHVLAILLNPSVVKIRKDFSQQKIMQISPS